MARRYDYKMSEELHDALYENRRIIEDAQKRQTRIERVGGYAHHIANVLSSLLEDAQSYNYGEGYEYQDVMVAVSLIETEYANGMAQIKKMMEDKRTITMEDFEKLCEEDES